MSRPTRRLKLLVLALAAILVVALGGYSLSWYQLAGSLRNGLDRWVAGRNATGWKIATGDVTVDGFPFVLRLSLPTPSVTDPEGDAWQGPPMTAVTTPFGPNRVHLTAAGRHSFTWAGGMPIEAEAKDLSADLVLDADGSAETSLDVTQASVGTAHLDRLMATVQRLSNGPADHTTPTWGLKAGVESLVLPNDPRLVLGRTIGSARLEVRLLGRVPPGPLRDGLAKWRDDGGTVDIDSLSLYWPPLGLTGSGTLALDHDMQPLLASRCTIRGLFGAVDTLTRDGIVHAKDAGVAKLILGLLMKPAADGVQELAVPVTLQNRALYVGPAHLMKIPEVRW